MKKQLASIAMAAVCSLSFAATSFAAQPAPPSNPALVQESYTNHIDINDLPVVGVFDENGNRMAFPRDSLSAKDLPRGATAKCGPFTIKPSRRVSATVYLSKRATIEFGFEKSDQYYRSSQKTGTSLSHNFGMVDAGTYYLYIRNFSSVSTRITGGSIDY